MREVIEDLKRKVRNSIRGLRRDTEALLLCLGNGASIRFGSEPRIAIADRLEEITDKIDVLEGRTPRP